MMDRFQHRRSKSCQGNVHLRKRVDAPYSGSDSSGYGLTEEDFFPSESRWSRSQQTSEASIKKLLAEEMSKEMEAKRRPPSVIAKLMGLDALPTQPPVKRQQRKLSENYLHRTASLGSIEKSPSYEGRSLRMSNKEQQEFKDVYEVLEPSKHERHLNSLGQKGRENSKLSEAKMEYVRQKFLDVKRLSTDEKLQQSKEFHDALDVLDSNKDLLLKFLQEPDTLFTKHLQDLQGVPPRRHPSHITLLKSSNVNGNGNWKSDKKKELDDVEDSMLKPSIRTVDHVRNKHSVFSSGKVLKSQLGEKDETGLVPTRIVVLKPNLRKGQNTERPASSSGSLGGHPLGHRKHMEYQRSENMELFSEVRDRRSSSIELEVLKHRNRGSRELAKEITRQMRHSVNSRRVSSSRLRGYAGDESSDSVSGNDSANEFELMTPASQHFHDLKNRYSPSSSYSTESSVSREAKKRLSERWKMTHRFQEVGKVGRGSTLGEMLAMPDRETRSTKLESAGPQDGFTDIVARNTLPTSCSSPLGISSRDGWKDECGRSLPRSRSLPASSTVFGSPKTSTRRGALVNDRFSVPKESGNRSSSRSRKGDFEQTESYVPRSSSTRSRAKKSRSFTPMDNEKHNTVQEAHLKLDEPRINIKEEDQPDKKIRNLELPEDDVEETIYVTDEIAVATPEEETISCESPLEQLSAETVCSVSVNDGDTSLHTQDNPKSEIMPIGRSEEISSHCTLTEVESPASCKEVGQPSPVSVLEPAGVDDLTPDSDSFEKVSADLHGLRMQLQLLKLESSDSYSDGFEMMVSSDEDIEEGSIGLQKENAERNRDFSYVVDVLVVSGIQDEDMDVLLTMYSPEGLVRADVFENLEKKYGEQTWPRSERRLLFNRVNFGLIEILQPQIDPHPWVKLGKKVACERRDGPPLAEEVWSVIVNQGKEEGKDLLENVIGKDVKWLDLRGDIDVIGREIERLLFDELVAEVARCEM